MTPRRRNPSAYKFNLTKSKAKLYGSRGGSKIARFRFKIGDEHLTYAEIGARLGISEDTASNKVRACLARGLAPTWELLGLQI